MLLSLTEEDVVLDVGDDVDESEELAFSIIKMLEEDAEASEGSMPYSILIGPVGAVLKSKRMKFSHLLEWESDASLPCPGHCRFNHSVVSVSTRSFATGIRTGARPS